MLENQSKKILLLSDDPADASFLSEIAVTQQADLELMADASELCAKIAESRTDQSLAAIFVDVSAPTQLRKFEFELQSKMGNSLALELSKMVHFISGESLAMNREVLQSPYFSFYAERKNHDFPASARFYQQSFYRAEEFLSSSRLGFDSASRVQFLENVKKDLSSKGASSEWWVKFRPAMEEMLGELFPARFDCSLGFSQKNLKVAITSAGVLDRSRFHPEKFLHYGVSAAISHRVLVLFIPVFAQTSEAVDAFKFYKVES